MDRRDTPELAVVIPCRDHAEELGTCLASLRAQDPPVPFELVVVESGGCEGAAAVAERFPEARLVRSPAPLAPGAARNLGVASTRAPVLAFLDADCAAEPGWLASVRAELSGSAGAVGGPVLDLLPRHPVAAADNFLQFYDLHPRRAAGPNAYLPACNLAVDRRSFEALGGFPEEPVGEDVLFTLAAARRLPGGIRFVPAMRVRHHGRTRLRELVAHHRRFGRARGRLGFLTGALDRRLAHRAGWAAPLLAKRLAYMTWRTARHRPLHLARLAALSPLVLLGAAAWSVGMVEGARERAAHEIRGGAIEPTPLDRGAGA